MNKITPLLQRRINETTLNPRKFSSPVTLAHGLKIQLKRIAPGIYKLYLSREGKIGPSESEIETILRAWPEVAQPPTPETRVTSVTLTVKIGK